MSELFIYLSISFYISLYLPISVSVSVLRLECRLASVIRVQSVKYFFSAWIFQIYFDCVSFHIWILTKSLSTLSLSVSYSEFHPQTFSIELIERQLKNE